MVVDHLTRDEFDSHMARFKAMVEVEYQHMLASHVMPPSVRGEGTTVMLNLAIRKVARSIWLPPEARQPEKSYGLR